MIIKGQKIKTKWLSFTKDLYESKGYIFTKYGDEFFLNVEDLSDGSDVKVEIECDTCHSLYEDRYCSVISGREKYGKDLCLECKKQQSLENNRIKRSKKRYLIIKDICDKEGYILISKELDFYDIKKKFKFVCPIHGEQENVIERFLNGSRCYWCGREAVGKHNRYDEDVVESIVNGINNNILLNKQNYINNITPNLIIKCGECGENTFQTSLVIYQGGRVMCNSCSQKESKNERIIKELLDSLEIFFEQEKRFDDCKDRHPLPFDFYLPEYNLCIEYDGELHYKPVEYFGGDDALEITLRHDQIKTQYCKDNNINLLRIPYWEKENIEKIILDELEKSSSLLKCA